MQIYDTISTTIVYENTITYEYEKRNEQNNEEKKIIITG